MRHALRPVLIGLNSPCMESGKSTLAERLVDKHGFHLVSFADPVKEMLTSLLRAMSYDEKHIHRLLYEDLKHTPIPPFGRTAREMMQTLGTEWGRDLVHPNLWVHLAARKIERLLSEGTRVVVDDVRLPNEAACVLSLGGAMYRITRPSAQKYNDHRSEGGLDNLGLPEVTNAGTVEELHESADLIARGEF